MANQDELKIADRLQVRIADLENLIASTKNKIEEFPENKILLFLVQQDEGRLKLLKEELEQVEVEVLRDRLKFSSDDGLKMTG